MIRTLSENEKLKTYNNICGNLKLIEKRLIFPLLNGHICELNQNVPISKVCPQKRVMANKKKKQFFLKIFGTLFFFSSNMSQCLEKTVCF